MLLWIAFSCIFSFPEDFWTFILAWKSTFLFKIFLANFLLASYLSFDSASGTFHHGIFVLYFGIVK
jgi:hypothetical protein